jgi:hypothetical protein
VRCAAVSASTGRLRLWVGAAGTLLVPTAAAAARPARGGKRPGSLRKNTTEIAMTTVTPITSPNLASLGISRVPSKQDVLF